MAINKGIKWALTLLAITSCGQENSVKDYQANDKAKAFYNKNVVTKDVVRWEYNICDLSESKWDSILLIKPYIDNNELKNNGIANYTAISSKAGDQALSESTCTLLFVENGRYVGYSVVGRSWIDLTTLSKNQEKQGVWINKADCSRIVVDRVGNKFKALFVQ